MAPSLDLQKLSEVLPDAKYNPEEVPALVIQFIKPRSVVTLFADGTVSVTGPRSMADVEDIMQMLRERLLFAGVQPEQRPEITVHNTTVSADLGRTVNLRALAKSLNTTYKSRQFPGLIYRTEDPKTIILLFRSGKIVCNGVTMDEMKRPLDALLEKLVSLGI